MDLAGFIFAFLLAIFLISRGFNMGLSLLIGGILSGLFASLDFITLITVLFNGVISYMSIQLMLIVGLISGLGYIMKKTGDLEMMIQALNSLFANIRFLLMFIPALVGTLNIPGGAILSAPMVEESGSRIDLSAGKKNALNLFYRHIGFFVYPLYPSMILLSELMNINITEIIKYTAWVSLLGIISSYFVLFKNTENKKIPDEERSNTGESIKNFFNGFFSILVILVLALVFNIPFHYAVLAGTITALIKKLNKYDKKINGFINRVRDFLIEGVDYQLVFTIAGLMAFKEIIEYTGIINDVAEHIINAGVSLPVLVTLLGLLAGYISGVHVAATGMLVPLFLPMFSGGNIAVLGALLFTTINIGYIISPLHLCLVLGNEYFDDSMASLYKKLAVPLIIMVLVSVFQVLVFG